MEFDIKLIFNRIKIAKGFKRDAELARFLQITPQNLSNCIIRNTVDWKNLLSNCVDISVDWLLTGKGEMFRNSSENIPNNLKSHTISQDNCDDLIKYLLKRIKDLEEEVFELKKEEIGSDDVWVATPVSYKKTGTM